MKLPNFQKPFRTMSIYGAFGLLCFLSGFFLKEGIEHRVAERIETNDEVVMEVLSRMIVLPAEPPSIVTVTDKEKLIDQSFFLHAENGDKVVMYPQSKRAYLFRPREQKIIDIAVIAIENSSTNSIPVFQTDGQ